MSIIDKLYKTKIDSNNYNVNIDSDDTLITVKLLDFNNNPVTYHTVTVSCDKGYFNARKKYNPNVDWYKQVNQSIQVSYTTSKITFTANDSFDGQKFTSLIVNLSSNGYDYTIEFTDAVLTNNIFEFDLQGLTIQSFSIVEMILEEKVENWKYYTGYPNTNNLNNITSYTGSTDGNGEINLYYTATDWGLVTFNCEEVVCQIEVKGIRKIIPLHNIPNYSLGTQYYDSAYLYVDGANNSCTLVVNYSASKLDTLYTKVTNYIDSLFVPFEYVPYGLPYDAYEKAGCYRSDVVWTFLVEEVNDEYKVLDIYCRGDVATDTDGEFNFGNEFTIKWAYFY